MLDVMLCGGVFAALYLFALTLHDDNGRPQVENFPGGSEVEMDDDLELSWSRGVGDWR